MASHLSTRLWSECRVALLWLAKSGRARGRPGPRKSTKGRCVTAASYRHIASSLLPPSPSSVTWHPLYFLDHLNCFCPSDRLMKTENIRSEAPFLKRKLPRHSIFTLTDPQIFQRIKFPYTCETTLHKTSQHSQPVKTTRTPEPTRNNYMSPLTVKGPHRRARKGVKAVSSTAGQRSFSALMRDKAASCDSLWLRRQDKHRQLHQLSVAELPRWVFSALCSMRVCVCFKGGLYNRMYNEQRKLIAAWIRCNRAAAVDMAGESAGGGVQEAPAKRLAFWTSNKIKSPEESVGKPLPWVNSMPSQLNQEVSQKPVEVRIHETASYETPYPLILQQIDGLPSCRITSKSNLFWRLLE